MSRKLLRREAGYEVWEEISRPEFEASVIDGGVDPEGAEEIVNSIDDMSGNALTLESTYTPDGHYIGEVERAQFLCGEKGIAPEKSDPEHNVCSIGFCEREQKWYGWSHRAIFGFDVGATVKPGDCAYQPKDKEDFRQDCLRFWDDDNHEQTVAFETRDKETGQPGVQTDWTYNESVPNEKMRGGIGGVFTPYPEEFGQGEWTAVTLDDAKRMAIAFAESVS